MSLPPELEKYRSLTEKHAAAILGCQPMTMSNWRSQRRGPPYIKVQRSIYYNLQALLDWQAQYRIDPQGR